MGAQRSTASWRIQAEAAKILRRLAKGEKVGDLLKEYHCCYQTLKMGLNYAGTDLPVREGGKGRPRKTTNDALQAIEDAKHKQQFEAGINEVKGPTRMAYLCSGCGNEGLGEGYCVKCLTGKFERVEIPV